MIFSLNSTVAATQLFSIILTLILADMSGEDDAHGHNLTLMSYCIDLSAFPFCFPLEEACEKSALLHRSATPVVVEVCGCAARVLLTTNGRRTPKDGLQLGCLVCYIGHNSRLVVTALFCFDSLHDPETDVGSPTSFTTKINILLR